MTPRTISPASEAPTRVRWRILGWLMALCFVSHLNRLAMSVAGTEHIIPERGVSPERMGVVYTAFLACYTTGMILGGWGIDRLGPRVMLWIMGCGSALFGALTGALGFAALAPVNFLLGLVMVRGAMGFFTTPLHPACAQAVSHWFPAHQASSANGWVTFAAVLGMASTWPLFGGLSDLVGWPTAFLIAAAVLLAVARAWAVDGRDRIDQHPSPNRAEREWVRGRGRNASPEATVESDEEPTVRLVSRGLGLLTLSYAAVGYFQYLFFYWAEFYFKDVLRLGTAPGRTYTTLLVLALGFGMPIGGWLSDRAQRRRPTAWGWRAVPATAMLASACLLFLGINATEPATIVGLFAASMLALGASESSFWQAAIRLGGPRGGTAAAIVNTGGNGVGLLAPLLTPVIGARLGWHWGIAVGGIVGLLGALCWLGIDPSPRRGTARK